MAPDIGFAVLPHTNDSAVFGVELTYGMVDRIAAVFTKNCDNLVL